MEFLTALIILFGTTEADENLLNRLPSTVSVLAYSEARNLRIYPLSYAGSFQIFKTLNEAVDEELVVIQEKGSGSVNAVMMKNKGKNPVFAMAGEIIKGARQDRMLENDILLPPSSDWIEVSVYCTEHGRWSGTSEKFASADINVSPSVRANARANKSQSEVWAEVEQNQQDVMGASSSTQAFRHIYESKDYQDDRNAYYSKLKDLVKSNSSIEGVIVCVGDDVLCIDLFSSHTMLSELWPKLLDSYIVEAMRGSDDGHVSLSEAKEFLEEYSKVDLDDEYTQGTGDLYEVESGDAQGSALLYNGILVHTDLFPEQELRPAPRYE